MKPDRPTAFEDIAPTKIGETRLMIGSAIGMMARAPKSRSNCHFAAANGLRSMLEGYAPQVPGLGGRAAYP
jgi:hypothetical protein